MAITLKPAQFNSFNVGINDLHDNLNNVIKINIAVQKTTITWIF